MLSVTRAIFKFLPLVILQIKFFYSFYLFCKFSYSDQFYSFKLEIISHHFLTECSSVTCVQEVFKFHPLYFYRNIYNLYSFIFFTFSLDQFYRFTCTIHLYRFTKMFYPSHVLFFKVLSLVILQKQFLYSFTQSQIYLFRPILYFYTCNSFTSFFSTMFIRHTGNF